VTPGFRDARYGDATFLVAIGSVLQVAFGLEPGRQEPFLKAVRSELGLAAVQLGALLVATCSAKL
jgi:hypothetical protein